MRAVGFGRAVGVDGRSSATSRARRTVGRECSVSERRRECERPAVAYPASSLSNIDASAPLAVASVSGVSPLLVSRTRRPGASAAYRRRRRRRSAPPCAAAGSRARSSRRRRPGAPPAAARRRRAAPSPRRVVQREPARAVGRRRRVGRRAAPPRARVVLGASRRGSAVHSSRGVRAARGGVERKTSGLVDGAGSRTTQRVGESGSRRAALRFCATWAADSPRARRRRSGRPRNRCAPLSALRSSRQRRPLTPAAPQHLPQLHRIHGIKLDHRRQGRHPRSSAATLATSRSPRWRRSSRR